MIIGGFMDNFIDKLAQKFSAQDIIKANSEAETAEYEKLKLQVSEYEKILQEMRKLNYKNSELSEKIVFNRFATFMTNWWIISNSYFSLIS